MSVHENDPIDRAIDEVLASMVQGEPRRVSAASVWRGLGERRKSALPMWLAAAAALIAVLGLAQRVETPPKAPLSTRTIPTPSMVASPAPTPSLEAEIRVERKRPATAMTSEPVYEGLPRLEIASIDLPQPLATSRLGAEPIQIPGIEITPLSVSSLSNELENK